MSSIVFDLSPPEATKNFIDGLKRKQVLTRDSLRELQRTSLSAGVHPADYERLFLEYAKSDYGACVFTCPCCGTTKLSLLTACKTCDWDISKYLKYITHPGLVYHQILAHCIYRRILNPIYALYDT